MTIWRTETEDALRVRKEIEEWLTNIKDEVGRRGIETYLKREDNQQVRGAYFELYLHERMTRNGFKIDCQALNPIEGYVLSLVVLMTTREGRI